MSFANDGFATSTSGRPPVGSTVDSKSAHPQANAIPISVVANSARMSACARVTLRVSSRIARVLVKVNAREHTSREQASRCVEELAGKARRSPRVHRAADESVRPRRAHLENGMIGIARAIGSLDTDVEDRLLAQDTDPREIGRASCRERG